MARQVEIIRRRTREMLRQGSAIFGYRIPFTGNDVMRLKGLAPGPEVKDCLDYLLKLAFVNPLRPQAELEKHLFGYHPKSKSKS